MKSRTARRAVIGQLMLIGVLLVAGLMLTRSDVEAQTSTQTLNYLCADRVGQLYIVGNTAKCPAGFKLVNVSGTGSPISVCVLPIINTARLAGTPVPCLIFERTVVLNGPTETVACASLPINRPLRQRLRLTNLHGNCFLGGQRVIIPPAHAVAANDFYYATFEQTLTVPAPGLLSNDTLNSATISAYDSTSTSGGSVSVNPDGGFSYTPPGGFTGTDTFGYTLSNAGGLSSATVTIQVMQVPVARDDEFQLDNTFDGTIPAPGVLANDDQHGATISTPGTTSAGGTVTVNADGSVNYTAPAAPADVDTFTYTLTNPVGESTATVTLVFNQPPDAVDDTAATDEDTRTSGNVLTNDTDPDGDPLSVTAINGTASDVGTQITLPSGALLTLNADGSFDWNPNGVFNHLAANAPETDTFTYTASDGRGGSDSATVTINITGTNDTPVAADDAYSSTANTALIVSAAEGLIVPNDTDRDGDTLSVSDVNGSTANVGTTITLPSGAQLTVDASGAFSWNPNGAFDGLAAGESGSDSFTYRVTDGQSDSNTATVIITVTGVNDDPTGITIQPSPASVDENVAGAVVGTLTAVDPDAGDSHIFSVDDSRFEVVGDQLKLVDGISLDHETEASVALNVTATDSGNRSTSETITITVNDVNEAPTGITVSGTLEVLEDVAGAVVGDVTVDDPDAGDRHTFDVDDSRFEVVNGELRLATGESLDYETEQSVTITITATDSGGLEVTDSFKVTVINASEAPIANADAYGDVIGNVLHTVDSACVLANDSDPDSDAIAAVAGTITSAKGGTVTMAADGCFNYNPPPGLSNTTDTFTYTIRETGTAEQLTSTATVTMTIMDELIWFIDGKATTNGDGRFTSPFDSVLAFNINAPDDPGDIIFLYSSPTAYSNGFTLLPGQQLLGEPFGLTVNGRTLVTAGGTNPTITNGTGSGITLANNTMVQRVNVAGSLSSAITAQNVDNATIGSNSELTNNGFGAVTIIGGNGTISIGASIVNHSGPSVVIHDRTGGSVTLTGSIHDTGQGVQIVGNTGGVIDFSGSTMTFSTGLNSALRLDGNPGTTITFSGGSLNINTTTGTGVFGRLGGTLAITGANNILNTSGGRAVYLESITIASSGITFQSISANGGSAGIQLTDTGTGSFNVTGNGNPNSGGTIRNMVGDGLQFVRAANISLNYMSITGNGGSGIYGDEVTNFSIANSSVTNNAAGSGSAAGLRFHRLYGSNSVSNTTITGSPRTNVLFTPSSGTSSLNVTSGLIGQNGSAEDHHGIAVIASGTANPTIVVIGTTFQDVAGTAVMVHLSEASQGNLTVSAASFTRTDSAVRTETWANTGLRFNIQNNTQIVDSRGNAIEIFAHSSSTTSSTIRGTIAGNMIGANRLDSGSRDANGIVIRMEGDQRSVIAMMGNTVRNTESHGIWISSVDFLSTPGVPSGRLDVTVQNNTVGLPEGNSGFTVAVHGVMVESQHTTTTCLDMTNNTSAGRAGAEHFWLRQTDSAVFILEQFSDGDGIPNEVISIAAVIKSFVELHNNLGSVAFISFAPGYGFTEATAGACQMP